MSLTQLRSRGILNGTISADDLASGVGGKVLQVVSTVITGTVSISTNNAPADITGLSATITPSSASNKILILYKINYSNASGDTFVGHIVRGSTNLFQGTGTGQAGTISFQTANMNNYWSFEAGGSFLDSPNTTSATTYKIQADNNANLTMYFNRTARADANNDPVVPSSITLMEIAG